MASVGDTVDDMPQPDNDGTPKVNGEINGSYDEPMEVEESPVKALKKINSSDINCISDNKDISSDTSEPIEQTNSVSESSVLEVNTAQESEVPENKESPTSNGYSEEEKQAQEQEEVEENDEKIEGKVVGRGNDEQTADNERQHKEDHHEEDEDVMLMEEEAKDPFSSDSDPHDKDQDNVDNSADAAETSEVEDIEDKDPLTSIIETEHKETESEVNEDLDHSAFEEEKSTDNQKCTISTEDKEDELVDGNVKKEILVDGSVEKEISEENQSESKDDTKKEEDASEESQKMEEDDDDDKNDGSTEKTKPEEENEKTPDKGKKKKIQQQPINITPRRSSRNVNKPKTYIDEPDIKGNSSPPKKASDDPDIEEIVPQDPLAMDSPVSDKKNKKTVVVNDPKRLVEIASGSKQTKPGKKEPTLVIIDTNSILSGRGPVPVSPSSPLGHSPNIAGTSQAYSVLPVALPAQGMYPQPLRHPQIKPVAVPSPAPAPKPPVILPSLTDDMYVVEAPSFIVPYVYEKPPIKPLKGFVDQVEQAIKEIKAQLEKEKEEKQSEEKAKEKVNEDDEKKEKNDKESSENEEVVKDSKEGSVEKEETMNIDVEDSKSAVDGEKSESAKDNQDSKELDKSETKIEEENSSEKPSEEGKSEDGEKVKKQSSSYFDNPLGKFFIQIGVNLVQEHVQTDLLRSQKRKKEREGSKCTPEVQQAMNSLIRSLEFSKETNEPFKLELKKCEFCSFKTESALVMAHHLETPHMRNYVYRCNFCSLEVRSPHDILYHMEAEHNVRGRLERAPAFHQCPSCPFEDNQKGKLSRHLLSCAKKYRPERNQEPPLDFEPPAKIPRVSRNRPNSMSPGTAVYQAAMSGLKQGAAGPGHPLLPKLVPAPSSPGMRGRGRPQMINRYLGDMRSTSLAAQQKAMAAQMRPGMLYRPSGTNAQPQVLLPASYQLAGTQLYQVTNHSRGLASAPLALPTQGTTSSASKGGVGASTAKLLQQPSISITPLPRQQPPPPAPTPAAPVNKPGRPAGNSKATFVICEICDGYIKDLEQLRNHMQWIHKVKIHPKMIYNRPPLNCQKCQFRFFTDQGLERHLLGSHGLVTSSMQEAANKGKDGGRCPVCGRVYQWKLLNHVARDHNMSLKPAHLSYKCTVCTATFGMYKQFENHVYSAHSVVAKRVMDKKPSSTQPSTSSQGDMLKPLKINDEITIIPQPARSKTKPTGSTRNPQKKV